MMVDIRRISTPWLLSRVTSSEKKGNLVVLICSDDLFVYCWEVFIVCLLESFFSGQTWLNVT